MNNKINKAIDKLFDDAKNGDDKAGNILVEIFNEFRRQTMKSSIPKYPIKELRWKI